MKEWSDSDVATLLSHSRTHTAEQIAVILGRTGRSVRQKAARLKVRTKLDINCPPHIRAQIVRQGMVDAYLDSPMGRLQSVIGADAATASPAVPYPCSGQMLGVE